MPKVKSTAETIVCNGMAVKNKATAIIKLSVRFKKLFIEYLSFSFSIRFIQIKRLNSHLSLELPSDTVPKSILLNTFTLQP